MGAASTDDDPATVVLVEGESDELAVRAVAARSGVDLARAGVAVRSMGGVTNLRRHLGDLAENSSGARVLGLFDRPERAHVESALRGAGIVLPEAPDALTRLGFFACDPDLEGELIRALGPARVEAVLAAHGELQRFRTFQWQPAQRTRPVEAQLRRFFGTHSGRKARFAPILIAELDEDRIPDVLRYLVQAAVGSARGALIGAVSR